MASTTSNMDTPLPSRLWLEQEQPLFKRVIGSSLPMREVLKLVLRIAKTRATVLLLGESGTGKTELAKIIHDLSDRHRGPFVVVPAGIPTSLIMGELFGIVEGAATNVKARRGYVVAADGGTLFIDEVADLSKQAQLALLRFMQDSFIAPIGSDRPIRSNCRVIVATWKNLEEEVKAGRFRQDLYYRIQGTVIRMPALRERRDDIRELAPVLLEKQRKALRDQTELLECQLTGDAIAALLDFDWPGNVRQLEKVLGELIVRASKPTISAAHVRRILSSMAAAETPPAMCDTKSDMTHDMSQVVSQVVAALGRARIDEIAVRAGVTRRTAYRHVAELVRAGSLTKVRVGRRVFYAPNTKDSAS